MNLQGTVTPQPSSRDAELERQLVLAFGPLTPAELMAELRLLDDIKAANAAHRHAVADACAGRPTLLVADAYYDLPRGGEQR